MKYASHHITMCDCSVHWSAWEYCSVASAKTLAPEYATSPSCWNILIMGTSDRQLFSFGSALQEIREWTSQEMCAKHYTFTITNCFKVSI